MLRAVFHSMLQSQAAMLMVLAILVMLSGMAVAFVKYESRKLFNEMERLRVQRDELVVDWGRLQIELATWAEQGRIEEIAMHRLRMRVPKMTDILVIRP